MKNIPLKDMKSLHQENNQFIFIIFPQCTELNLLCMYKVNPLKLCLIKEKFTIYRNVCPEWSTINRSKIMYDIIAKLHELCQ